MKPALLIVDLLRDTFDKYPDAPITRTANAFLPILNEWLDLFHDRNLPVIFSCDSFLAEDFIFQGKISPHSLRNTPGSEIIGTLHRHPNDSVLEKRRFSSFFKTDLDQTLRTWQVDTILVTGITTPYCVLTTALDAVSNDFHAIIVEDCCAAHRPEQHDQVLNTYRLGPLYPLLQVLDSQACKELLHIKGMP